jgi:hypothetical protein
MDFRDLDRLHGRNDWIWRSGSGGVWRLTFLTQMRFDVEASETKSV